MKIPPVKGTRDFYPREMAVRNWIIDGWKRISLRNGFEEYDGPIFEYLQMYTQKSGQEIAEQLFSLTDRGGRDLAIRPEITPTLARMVNQQINSLPRPIKWFSVPRLCRAERPQKGRLREFFQWNIDIIGVDDVLADAEVIFCAVDYLREIGLTANDVVIKISSRKMLAALLHTIGIGENLEPLYTLLDKKSKLPADTFIEMLKELLNDDAQRTAILKLMNCKTIDEISSVVKFTDEVQKAVDELKELFDMLSTMGIADFCVFDIGIIRGLAYYTGVVFEVYDRSGELRAIGGGGRYDNLLHDFGGPTITATGFGMGDCVLAIVLEEKGLLAPGVTTRKLDYYVTYADKEFLPKAIEITTRLRHKGLAAELSYKGGNLGKQIKAASDAGAKKCIIVGQELKDRGEIAVKDLSTGQQKLCKPEELINDN
jgi:histidyl-tRNA synthetase